MTASRRFLHALYAIDEGDLPTGERLLRECLASAEAEEDPGTRWPATLSLGRLLARCGRREEAHVLLADVAGLLARRPDAMELFGFEVDRARSLLGELDAARFGR